MAWLHGVETRLLAAAATCCLPGEMAGLHIERAVTEGAPEVARVAREFGQLALGEPLPIPPLAAVPAGALEDTIGGAERQRPRLE